MKKAIKWGALVIVVLVVAASFVVGALMGPVAQRILTDVISPALGVKVEAAAIDISPMSGACRITGFQVGGPEGFKSPHVFKFDKMTVDVDVWSLLGDVVIVEQVLIEGGQTVFETGRSGSNLTKLVETATKAVEGGSGLGTTASSGETTGKLKMPSFGKKDTTSGSPTEEPKSAETAKDQTTAQTQAAKPGAKLAAEPAASSGVSTGSAGSAQPAAAPKPAKPLKVMIEQFSMRGCGVEVVSVLTVGKAVAVPMGDVEMKDIGKAEGGVSPAKAMAVIIAEVAKASAKAALQKSGAAVKDVAGKTGEAAKDAAAAVKENTGKLGDPLKGLLKK